MLSITANTESGINKMKTSVLFIILVGTISVSGCNNGNNSLEVTATAYTSNIGETDSTPTLTAWGDTLRPGMKSIAVSRDLIDRGLSHGVQVSIEGLDGQYSVLDKMNKRWTKKIDIYMGEDKKAAKEWGKKQVVIHWENSPD